MLSKDLLKQQRVIQIFGVLMLASPFANLYISIYTNPTINKWTWPILKMLLKEISIVHWILWSCSLLIGIMMLKGKRESWISVLGLLSLFIFYNIITLKTEIAKSGWLPVFLLLCNVVVFIVVYLAEFRRPSVKTSADARIKPETAHRLSNRPMPSASPQLFYDLKKLLNVTVAFEGLGPWAKVIDVKGDCVVFEPYHSPPAGIEDRPVEVLLGNLGLILSFKSKEQQRMTFKCHEVLVYRSQNIA
jgi:fumarate reductase subunit C